MFRILAHIGPLTIYAYGAMLAVAFISGTMLAMRRAAKQAIPAERIVDLVFFILIASLSGARVLFVALNWDYYRTNLPDIFKVWEGGLVFYGGLLAGLAAALWYLKKNRLPVYKILDIIAPSAALGIFFGRLGCFLNGCCYGHISQSFGVVFPARNNPPVFDEQVMAGLIMPSAACSLPVIPTQLYDAAAGLAIMAALLWLERYKKFDGAVFWLFVFLYAVSRFITEIFRSYQSNFIFGCVTVSQLISVILFCVSGSMLVIGYKKGLTHA